MSILSRREAPENACSPARRRCLPAPLRLLSLSPSSSFISVRKTLSQCLPTICARRQPPAPPSILGIRMEKKITDARGEDSRLSFAMIQNNSFLLLPFFFLFATNLTDHSRNTFQHPRRSKISRKNMQ